MSIRKVASLLETPTISYISLIRALTWIEPNILTFYLIISGFFQLQARCRTHVHFYVNKNRDHSFLLIDKYDTFNFNVTTFSRPVQHTIITLYIKYGLCQHTLKKLRTLPHFSNFQFRFFFLTINFNPLWKKERAYFFQVRCNKGLKLYVYSKGSLSHPAISRQLHVNAAMDSRG